MRHALYIHSKYYSSKSKQSASYNTSGADVKCIASHNVTTNPNAHDSIATNNVAPPSEEVSHTHHSSKKRKRLDPVLNKTEATNWVNNLSFAGCALRLY